MELFLHVRLTNDFPSFDNSLREWVNKHYPKTTYFDIDSQSEALVIDTAKRAIDESSKVFVWIDNHGGDTQQLFGIFKQLKNNELLKPVVVSYNVSNPLLDKLAKGFNKPWKKISELSASDLSIFTT